MFLEDSSDRGDVFGDFSGARAKSTSTIWSWNTRERI
jgi:hypothetical protein